MRKAASGELEKIMKHSSTNDTERLTIGYYMAQFGLDIARINSVLDQGVTMMSKSGIMTADLIEGEGEFGLSNGSIHAILNRKDFGGVPADYLRWAAIKLALLPALRADQEDQLASGGGFHLLANDAHAVNSSYCLTKISNRFWNIN